MDTLLMLLPLLFLSHTTSFSRKTKITSPCNVIDIFNVESKLKQVGDNTWKNGCPDDRYIQAVYAVNPVQPFAKVKCCGSGSDASYSWEIRDLTLMASGSNVVDKKWNVECEKYSLITGFQFAKDYRLMRLLNGVRCSLLVNQVIDKHQCIVLTFNVAVTQTSLSHNVTWQHECPKGYGMVAVFDNLQFSGVRKAKCCKILDATFTSGYSANFSYNLGGFEQSRDSQLNYFWPITEAGLQVGPYTNLGGGLKSATIVSSGVTADMPFCLQLGIVRISRFTQVHLILKTNSSTTRERLDTKVNYETSVSRYINPTATSQICIESGLLGGIVYITKFKISDVKTCQAAQCYNKLGVGAVGCRANEECTPPLPYSKCQCKRGFKRTNRKCVQTLVSATTGSPKRTSGNDFTTHPTTGNKKGTDGVDFTTIRSKNATIKAESEVGKKRVQLPGESVSPWIYIAAGSASGIILVAIILAGCLCYRRNLVVKIRRMNSFEHEMAYINNPRHLLSERFSIESISTNNTLYRPYMPDIGAVEHLSAPSNQGSFLSTSAQTRFIEPTTGEPIYTRINRSLTINCPNNNNYSDVIECPSDSETVANPHVIITDESPVTQLASAVTQLASVGHHDTINDGCNSTIPCYRELEKESNNLEVRALPIDRVDRMPSCMTLLQPDYGDSDDEEEQEYAVTNTFFTPGDDEEELLSELNELPPESVQLSTKILGQGAFGLVKLGRLISVNGTQDIAIKILKQPPGLEITQSDRVKFYQEAAIMSQFEHQNVIALYGVIVNKKPNMVLEYLSRGNLWKYLNKIRRMRQREGVVEISRELHGIFLHMARDIASGMCYLASLKFVHRDLATRNVLLDCNLRCKIADFGLSRHFLKDEQYYTSHGGQIPVKWTAPEALQYKKYSSKSDVWSYGIVLWEIWSFGQRPYEKWVNDKVVKEVCEKGYRLPAPTGIPSLIYRLMIDCWHPDKNHRPTFTQIKFCLDHNDERILGSINKHNPLERTRSVTFSERDDELQAITIAAESGNELEEPYCKTE